MSVEITNQLLLLLLLILIGFGAQRLHFIDVSVGPKLSSFISNVTMPALYISTFMRRFSPEDLKAGSMMLGVSAFYYVLTFFAGILFVKLCRVDMKYEGVFRFMIVFSNAAFMAYPVLTAIYPGAAQDAIFLAVFFNIPFNALGYTLGVWLLRRGEESGFRWKLLLAPGSVSAFLGLFLFLISPLFPEPVYAFLYEGFIYDTLYQLGNTTIPLSMIVIGTVLAGVKFKDLFLNSKIYLLAVVRLLVLPAIVFAVVSFLPMSEMARGVCTVIAGMPCAVFAVILSQEYGGDEKTASIGVFVTTLLSFATIPLLCTLLG